MDADMSNNNGPSIFAPSNTNTSNGSLPSNGSQPTQSTRKRRKRSVTLLKKHKKDPNIRLEYNEHGEVIGDFERRFSNWVGVTTRSMVSITEPSWDKVDDKVMALLWLAIKDHWNIEDDKYKIPVLKVAGTSWKNFKKDLNRKYHKQGRNPCVDYPYLDEKTWKAFCVMKSTKEFLAKSEEGRKNAALNTNPARLGSRGYRSNYDNWSKEMMEPSDSSALLFLIQDERARNFLLARRVRDADGILRIPTYLQELVDKIIEKDRQASEGLWIPEPGKDVLIAVLGPEHPGRTRGVSHTVGLKKTIPRILEKRRKSRTRMDIDWEEKRMDFEAECDEKRKNFAAEMEEKRRIYRAEMEEKEKLLDAKIEKIMQLTSMLNTHDGSLSPGKKKSSCGSMPCLDDFDAYM
ncbi:hypothetical protein OSB04_021175 [Centaurea solstitialis]|uniref:Transposase n=1 Tax=Centaurea solstitialis TaxID=347529 RepID=A0AA38W4N4_9ASTR|nr:hypothetical protein OSB04_021175 [Centaurea solstitialis]